MTAILEHPAVPVAQAVVRDFGDLEPIDVLIRDDMAAVLLEGDDLRFVVFVASIGGQWVAPGMTGGTPRRMRDPQESRTGTVPLTGISRRWTTAASSAWFAVTAQAAADATHVALTTSVDSVTVPVGPNGLVFALARVPMPTFDDDRPRIETVELAVHTDDDRAVRMQLP